MNRVLSRCIVRGLVGLSAFGLNGCSGLSPAGIRDHVSSVDCTQAADMAEHSGRLRRVANDAYPKILSILKDTGRRAPRSFEIVFTNQLGGNVGQTVGGTIYLNAHYIATPARPAGMFQRPADVDAVLVHEMTHMAQQYDAKAAVHWAEGMADYICARLGYTNDLNCPYCSATYPHYRSGYQCAAAFLSFVERQYAPDIVPQLHRRLRLGSYRDSFFREICGKELDELWSDFQQTAAYTASARESLELQMALGFQDGNPPPDIVRRTEAHFRLPAGSITNALTSLIALKTSGELPGFARTDQASATLSSTSFTEMNPGVYPLVLKWYLRKAGEPSWHAFTLAQPSEGEPWHLRAAQRLSSDHRVAENLPVPAGPR